MQKRGIKGLYAGVPAVVIGNAAKAGVRFTTYDQFKAALKDDEVGADAKRPLQLHKVCWPAADPRATSQPPGRCSPASARA